jgi:hypothetical protein
MGILFRHRDLEIEKKEKGKREKETEKGEKRNEEKREICRSMHYCSFCR